MEDLFDDLIENVLNGMDCQYCGRNPKFFVSYRICVECHINHNLTGDEKEFLRGQCESKIVEYIIHKKQDTISEFKLDEVKVVINPYTGIQHPYTPSPIPVNRESGRAGYWKQRYFDSDFKRPFSLHPKCKCSICSPHGNYQSQPECLKKKLKMELETGPLLQCQNCSRELTRDQSLNHKCETEWMIESNYDPDLLRPDELIFKFLETTLKNYSLPIKTVKDILYRWIRDRNE